MAGVVNHVRLEAVILERDIRFGSFDRSNSCHPHMDQIIQIVSKSYPGVERDHREDVAQNPPAHGLIDHRDKHVALAGANHQNTDQDEYGREENVVSQPPQVFATALKFALDDLFKFPPFSVVGI